MHMFFPWGEREAIPKFYISMFKFMQVVPKMMLHKVLKKLTLKAELLVTLAVSLQVIISKVVGAAVTNNSATLLKN
jgi:hypothetical protein